MAVLKALCFAIPILLAVPFDPQWPDFERARRAVLLLLVGGSLVAFGARRLPAAPFRWLLALAAFALASITWAHDRLLALEQATYLAALFSIPLLGPNDTRVQRPLLLGTAVALLITSGFGIAQALGLEWPGDYNVAHEPVSSLGNRNVAAEWTAVAAPVAVFGHPILGWTSAAFGGVYLWANGGRAGLAAFHLAFVLLVLLRARRGRIDRVRLIASGLLLVVTAAIGWPLRPEAPAIAATAAASNDRQPPPPSTLRVRTLIWKGTAKLAVQHPIVGVGAGNFRVSYPLHRPQEEIDISTFGHRVSTRVVTAHNDPLQVFAEFGAVGAALLVMFLVSLIRGFRQRRPTALAIASLAAVVPIALLRAPLYNAPAALAVMIAVCIGSRRLGQPASGWWTHLGRVVGLGFAALGIAMLIGESHGAGFLRAKLRNDPPRGLAHLDSAIACDPFETDWRLLRSQIHHKQGRVAKQHLAQTLADLNAVLERRPGAYRALTGTGYLGLTHPQVPCGDSKLADKGRDCVKLLLELDRKHPEGLFLASDYAFANGNIKAGLKALELLGDKNAILLKHRQMRQLIRSGSNPQNAPLYGNLALKLKALGRKLFPDAEEFK